MAKLSAHGTEIGRVYLLTSAKAYMTDGKILENKGFGWKLSKRTLKAGVTAQQAFEHQRDHLAALCAARPAHAAYRTALHDLCGMSMRWKLDMSVRMMPDDCDGVWSECCDGYGDNVSASVDEIAELCRLYKDAVRESAELKQAETIAA